MEGGEEEREGRGEGRGVEEKRREQRNISMPVEEVGMFQNKLMRLLNTLISRRKVKHNKAVSPDTD